MNEPQLKNRFRSGITCAVLGLAGLAGLSPPLFAANESPSSDALKVSGFLSVVAGKVFKNSLDDNYIGPPQLQGQDCPCYIGDWGNGGLYTKRLTLTPESHAGLQGDFTVNERTHLIAQVVSRGTAGTPNVQWAFGSYQFDKNWQMHLGRKRIPLYFYSDFQDVGVAYPWVSPPPELYGWEVANYNGGGLRYSTDTGAHHITAGLFTGQEVAKYSLYQTLYYSGRTQVSWKSLIGTEVEVSRGPLTARGVYLQANVDTVNNANAINTTAALKAYGLALNVDFNRWFILSEFTQLSRAFRSNRYTVTAPAFTVGVGSRWQAWTVIANLAQYIERTDDLNQYQPQSFRRKSLTVRYDLDSRSALKVQLDRHQDITNNFGGDANVLRLAYDRTFW